MSKLTEKDGLIRENWYIACLSHELTSKPIQREIYDEIIVLYRVDGIARAQVDRCQHRFAKLSEGYVENKCIKCPYHGWSYNSEGDVVDIPSEGPDRDDKVIYKNKAFECVEREGAIWLWMGGAESTQGPAWEFPRYNDSGWVNYFMVTDFENDVTNLAENFMDVHHTVYVHKNWFRNPNSIKVPFSVDVKDGRALITYKQENDEIGVLTKFILNPYKRPMTHTDEFIYPNITRVDYMYGKDHGFVINSQITPISEYKSRVYTYIAYRVVFAGRLLKPFISFYTREVIEQDVVIMANQVVNLKRIEKHDFKSTDADEVHVAIERLRRTGIESPEKVKDQKYLKEKEFWI